MKNYYFKFQKGNAGYFTKNLFAPDNLFDQAKKFIKSRKEIPLSIYFGKWKSSEKDEKLSELKKKKEQKELKSPLGIKQIELFYKIPKLNDKVYFWSFIEDIVLCLSPIENKIVDGPDNFKDGNGSLPKSIRCNIHKVYRKIDLPEVLSNINSSQRYNRGTISELQDSANKIAESLINGSQKDITKVNILNYISPTEFETLLFLIFSGDNVFCSSYKGGSLKDFDLRIGVKKQFHEFKSGRYWIQAKLKPDIKGIKKVKDEYYACIGLDDISNHILGRNWLLERIFENQRVLNWLKEMIFNYSVYNIKF